MSLEWHLHEGRPSVRHVNWSPDNIPDQTGRTVVITGANSGIGFYAARSLAKRGANVLLACRRLDAAQRAADKINAAGGGTATAAHLDLEDLDSVRRFAAEDAPASIDLLINNAGIMMVPRRLSPQGFEAQWAVNVVGHVQLTRLLLDRVTDRVVTVSSVAHRRGAIDPATWAGANYQPWTAYAQSKLGDLLFALRLQRHLEESGSKVTSVACHPGVSMTRLAKDMPLPYKISMIAYTPFLQSAEKGSWPTLRAATDDVPGGSYWGPSGFREMRGPPTEAEIRRHALDESSQDLVWDALWCDNPAPTQR